MSMGYEGERDPWNEKPVNTWSREGNPLDAIRVAIVAAETEQANLVIEIEKRDAEIARLNAALAVDDGAIEVLSNIIADAHAALDALGVEKDIGGVSLSIRQRVSKLATRSALSMPHARPANIIPFPGRTPEQKTR